ncbi:MAG: DUF4293 domain-containing protein [Chlorobi bacterium]|nr:DUF4293 domain-containing protein [Chlorobiota bacterium]
MIQRIQSLWLFIATVAAVLTYFFPVIELNSDKSLMIYSFDSITFAGITGLIQSGYIIAALLGIIALLSFVTIFLYKNRVLQMRLCVFISLLDIILIILITLFSVNQTKSPAAAIGLSAILPLIIFIFVLMARRAILRDELLVKAADRIR